MTRFPVYVWWKNSYGTQSRKDHWSYWNTSSITASWMRINRQWVICWFENPFVKPKPNQNIFPTDRSPEDNLQLQIIWCRFTSPAVTQEPSSSFCISSGVVCVLCINIEFLQSLAGRNQIQLLSMWSHCWENSEDPCLLDILCTSLGIMPMLLNSPQQLEFLQKRELNIMVFIWESRQNRMKRMGTVWPNAESIATSLIVLIRTWVADQGKCSNFHCTDWHRYRC